MGEDSSNIKHMNNQTHSKEENKKDSGYSNSVNHIDEEQSFFDVFFDSVFIIRDKKILLANNKAINLLGYNMTEVIGKDLDLILNPCEGYVDEIDRIIRSIDQGKSVSTVELKLKRKDETIKYVEVTGKGYLFKGISSMLFVIHDITSEKQFEEHDSLEYGCGEFEINGGKQWYKQLVELTPDSLFVTKNEKIVFINNSGLKLSGFKDYKDVLGKSIREFVLPDEYSFMDERAKELYVEKKRVPTGEYKVLKADGSIMDMEIVSSPFLYGNEISIISIAHDITKRKAMEQALRESKESYAKLIEFLPDAVFIGENQKVVFVNRAGAELLGASSTDSLIGISILDFIHPSCLEQIKERMGKIRNDREKPNLIEIKLVRNDGELVDVEVSNILYFHRGKRRVVSIVRDITERKKAEENKRRLDDALRFDKLKTEFFSNISHELKTPLNIILGSIQLVDCLHSESKACKNYKKTSKYISSMRQNCYRLLRLINNLIDINKIDSGFLSISLTNHNIISVIEDITLSVSEYTQSKGIDLIFDTDVEEKMMAIDMDKIERMILNLLSNAIKFTEEGGSIYVNIYDKGDKICIAVRDTGIGIPEEMLDKIFDRFKQVGSSLIKNQGGSGIGLSLVKSIVEAHEGDIRVKSEYGLGSEFVIELPVKLVEEDSNTVHNQFIEQKNVERINIEFSDIYSR